MVVLYLTSWGVSKQWGWRLGNAFVLEYLLPCCGFAALPAAANCKKEFWAFPVPPAFYILSIFSVFSILTSPSHTPHTPHWSLPSLSLHRGSPHSSGAYGTTQMVEKAPRWRQSYAGHADWCCPGPGCSLCTTGNGQAQERVCPNPLCRAVCSLTHHAVQARSSASSLPKSPLPP